MTHPIGSYQHKRPDPRCVPLHEGERRRIAIYLRGGLTLIQTSMLTGVSRFTIADMRRSMNATPSAHGRG